MQKTGQNAGIQEVLTLSEQWRKIYEANKSRLIRNIQSAAVEAERPGITEALIDHTKLAEHSRSMGANFADFIKETLGMNMKEYDALAADVKDRLLKGTMPPEELIFRAIDAIKEVHEVSAFYTQWPDHHYGDDQLALGIAVANKLGAIRNRVRERVSEGELKLHSIAKRLDAIESSMRRISKLNDDISLLRRRDSTDTSIRVASTKAMLLTLHEERKATAAELKKAEGAVDAILFPLKGVSGKFDHLSANRDGKLTDFLDNAYTILDEGTERISQKIPNTENFMSKVEELHGLVKSGRINVKRQSETDRILLSCDTILNANGKGVDLVSMICAARVAEKRLLSIDEQINEANSLVQRGTVDIRSRDGEIERLRDKAAELKVTIDDAASMLALDLKQHGIELRTAGESFEIFDTKAQGTSI